MIGFKMVHGKPVFSTFCFSRFFPDSAGTLYRERDSIVQSCNDT